MKKNLILSLLIAAGFLGLAGSAGAQVAGATTSVDVSLTASTQVAMGWSVKKTILGKHIYSDSGVKIGRVEDLIVSPGNSVTYLIVGAGGFVGIGRHNVAIAVAQVQSLSGKLTLPGATKETIQAMPEFVYVSDTTRRDELVRRVELDLVKARDEVAALQQKSAAASIEVRAQIDPKINAVVEELKTAEAKLAELRRATATRWYEFEAGVSAANVRLRKSLDQLAG